MPDCAAHIRRHMPLTPRADMRSAALARRSRRVRRAGLRGVHTCRGSAQLGCVSTFPTVEHPPPPPRRQRVRRAVGVLRCGAAHILRPMRLLSPSARACIRGLAESEQARASSLPPRRPAQRTRHAAAAAADGVRCTALPWVRSLPTTDPALPLPPPPTMMPSRHAVLCRRPVCMCVRACSLPPSASPQMDTLGRASSLPAAARRSVHGMRRRMARAHYPLHNASATYRVQCSARPDSLRTPCGACLGDALLDAAASGTPHPIDSLSRIAASVAPHAAPLRRRTRFRSARTRAVPDPTGERRRVWRCGSGGGLSRVRECMPGVCVGCLR